MDLFALSFVVDLSVAMYSFCLLTSMEADQNRTAAYCT